MAKDGDKKRGRRSRGGENSQVGKPENSASNLTITDPENMERDNSKLPLGPGPVTEELSASEPPVMDGTADPAATAATGPGSAASLSAGHGDQSEAAGQLSVDDELSAHNDDSTSASEESLEMPRRLTSSQSLDLRSNSDCKQLAATALRFVETNIPPSSNKVNHDFTPQSLPDQGGDTVTLKDIMNAIMVSRQETSDSLKIIDNRLSEFEKSLDYAHGKTIENKQSIDELRSENKELKDTVSSLSTELAALRTEVFNVKSRQDATERRSREWGIRIYGVPELPREDTRRVLCNLIAEHSLAGLNTPAKASQAIEHCHRLGNAQPGKHRPIIANMFSRPLRNVLLKSAKAVNNDQSAIYFAEDMIKSDHEMKLKARNQMKAAHDPGQKVCFRRGKLIIDSRVTEITGLD